MNRFQAAMQQDVAWWNQFIQANTRPGQSLPYHEKSTLTPAEWEEMQGLAPQLHLRETSTATLRVSVEDDRLRLDGGAALPDLTGIVIDLDQDQVSTPIGVIKGHQVITGNDPSAAAPWAGTLWSRDMDPRTGTGVAISFGVGRMQGAGAPAILFYRAVRLNQSRVEARVERILVYEP